MPVFMNAFLLFFLSALLANCVQADEVKMDLLVGIGGFEYSGDTSWNVYGHPDYDFEAESGYVGDYRSTFALTRRVRRRINGSGSGDQVTIESVNSMTAQVSRKTYEFTNGRGASRDCIEVDVGADPSPANSAAALASVIAREQGSQTNGAVSVDCAGDTVYVKPRLHWELKAFKDSDASESRVLSAFRTWRYGFDPATPDDSVSVGWTRKSGETLSPAKHSVFQIVAGAGASGTNCQYIGLRDYSGPHGSVMLSTAFKTMDKPSNVHVGDRVTFRVDHIRMSDYSSLPLGVTVAFKIGIQWGAQRFEETIDPSLVARAYEVSTPPVPADVSEFVAYIAMSATGNIGASQPGMFIDEAHLFVKRAENPTEYVTWKVPAKHNGSVTTLFYAGNWDSGLYDLYDVAAKCDAVILGESRGALAAKLRYLNPSSRIYLYEITAVVDARDSRGRDPWYLNTPFGIGWILANHPGWLYSDGLGGQVYDRDHPEQYYMKLHSRECRTLWAEKCRDIALRWRLDGIYIDGLNPLKEERMDGQALTPERNAWEVQAFLHEVVPIFRSADCTLSRISAVITSRLLQEMSILIPIGGPLLPTTRRSIDPTRQLRCQTHISRSTRSSENTTTAASSGTTTTRPIGESAWMTWTLCGS